MPLNGKLIEGHPIGLDKIILGDLREKSWEADGQIQTHKFTDGTLLYDRTNTPPRPWFILVYESGKRVVD